MSTTTSLALLKGAKKAELEEQLSPQPEEPTVETAEVQEQPGDTAEEQVLTAEDIGKMTGKDIDALVKDNEVETPSDWSKLTVAKKREWLIAQMAEEPEAEEGAQEPELNTDAAGDETGEDEAPDAAPIEDTTASDFAAETNAAVEAEQQAEAPKATVKKAETQTTAKPAKKVASKSGSDIVAVQTKEGEIIPPNAITDLAHELTNLKEKEARELATTLLEAGEQTFFKVGIVLAHLQDNGWYQPYANFREFVEAEYGIQYRKAMYLIKIANDIIASGIDYNKVAPIGWGKLKDISSVLTKENVDQWVELAKKNTQLQLQELVAQSKQQQTTLPSSQVSELTSKTFKLHKDQKETVDEALSKAKGVSGTEVDSVALEFICTEYLNTGSSKPLKPSTEQIRKAIEEMGAEKAAALVADTFPDINFAVEA